MNFMTPRVLSNLADLENMGLLPYRPSPFAGILQGLASALLPLAQVREQRRLEEEERKRWQTEVALRAAGMYPPEQMPEAARKIVGEALGGTELPQPTEPIELQRAAVSNTVNLFIQHGEEVPDLLWKAYLKAYNLPEDTPKPKSRQELIDNLWRVVEFQIRTTGKVDPRVWNLLMQALGLGEGIPAPQLVSEQRELGFRILSLYLTTGQEVTPQVWEHVRPLLGLPEGTPPPRLLEAERENKTLAEVFPGIENLLPPHLRGFSKMPIWALRIMGQTGFLNILTDESNLPASTVLSDWAKNELRNRFGIDPDKYSIGFVAKYFPNYIGATQSIKMVFGPLLDEILTDRPELQALADLPASSDLVIAISDLYAKDKAARQQILGKQLDDLKERINDAVTKGASPDLVGRWIAEYNHIAKTLGRPEIDPETAKKILKAAATMYTLNVKKQSLEYEKIQAETARAWAAAEAHRVNIANSIARTKAYIANVTSSGQVRMIQAGVAVASEQRKTIEAINKAVDDRWNREVKGGHQIDLTIGGQKVTVRFFGGQWQVLAQDKKGQKVWKPIDPDMVSIVIDAIYKKFETEAASKFLSPTPAGSPSQPRQQQPKQQQKGQTKKTQGQTQKTKQQRPSVVKMERD